MKKDYKTISRTFSENLEITEVIHFIMQNIELKFSIDPTEEARLNRRYRVQIFEAPELQPDRAREAHREAARKARTKRWIR